MQEVNQVNKPINTDEEKSYEKSEEIAALNTNRIKQLEAAIKWHQEYDKQLEESLQWHKNRVKELEAAVDWHHEYDKQLEGAVKWNEERYNQIQQDYEELTRELEKIKEDNSNLRRTIFEMENSLAWKVTKFFRKK